MVSSSHDKSLRLWERTREPLILEEEREMVRTSGWVTDVLVGGDEGRRRGPSWSFPSSAVTPQAAQVQGLPEIDLSRTAYATLAAGQRQRCH